MMTNKWVQAALCLGVAVGIWLGGWIALLHPLASLILPVPIGLISLWISAKTRGTDGWGGPYNGKK
jgi:hypothetical protein